MSRGSGEVLGESSLVVEGVGLAGDVVGGYALGFPGGEDGVSSASGVGRGPGVCEFGEHCETEGAFEGRVRRSLICM